MPRKPILVQSVKIRKGEGTLLRTKNKNFITSKNPNRTWENFGVYSGAFSKLIKFKRVK